MPTSHLEKSNEDNINFSKYAFSFNKTFSTIMFLLYPLYKIITYVY